MTLLVAKALPKVLEKIYCTHQSLNLPVIVMFYTLLEFGDTSSVSDENA